MVNKFRMGNPEYSILIWLVSLVPLLIILFLHPPILVTILIFFSIIIGIIAITWMPYYVSKYRLRAGLDKCKENETTWCRVTKDRIIIPQFVDKGAYGVTHGITNKEKADVVDDGSFPCKWLNGNPAIVMYDGINTSVDLLKSIARKKMMKIYGIRSGVEGYVKAKKEKKVVNPDKR